MKKLKLILCGLLLSVSLAGCKNSYNDNPDFTEYTVIANRTFKLIPGNANGVGHYLILVDKETKVQYLYDDHDYGGGFVVLVDADGKPILYDGEV